MPAEFCSALLLASLPGADVLKSGTFGHKGYRCKFRIWETLRLLCHDIIVELMEQHLLECQFLEGLGIEAEPMEPRN